MPNPPVLKVEEIGISAEQNTFSRADWLDELAFRLAKDLRLSSQPGKRYPIPLCLKELETSLRSAYRHFQTSSQGEMAISHATEWLLDNFHIVEQTLRQVEEGLPASFYRRLPKINVNNNEISRIHLLAHVLISNCENSLDGNQLQPFIQAYQKGATLKIGEVWALPLMLRLCVLEVLASALANIAQLPFLYPGFLDKSWLATWSNEAYSPPSISDENAVINSIVSLRMLATQDWNSFFESTNLAERELRKDPANIYIQMDFETRNSYRNVIEDLATGTSIEETEIAVQAVQLALKGEKPSRRHVGYYLIGPGRSILEESLGYRPASGSLLRRWIYKNASPVYLGNIALFTALFCSIVIGYAIHAGANILQTILAGLLTVLPAASVVTDLINWTVVHFFLS